MKNAWRSLGWGSVLIVLLTVVAYLPALRGGFIWDDDAYVTNNPALRSAEGLRQIWLNPEATPQYYPLTFTVFWVEYHLWGLQPFGFHLVNVLLQAANAVLFWRLLSRLNVPGAWWAATVFALHPVHVMSVAWITELKNVLSGFCYLAALLSYLRFCGLDGGCAVDQARRRWFYGLALGLYLCALLSKTATSLLPVATLLMLWWKRGRVGRSELLPLLPFLCVGILFGGFTLWLEKYAKGASGSEFTLPFLDRFLVAGHSFWFSLGKLVWPSRLTFIYPRWQIDATKVRPYMFPLGAIALLVALWWGRRRIGRAPLAAVLYFTLAFPVLVLVQVLFMMRYSYVADHWQYLGSMGMIPLGVGGAVLALNRWASAFRRVGPVIGAVILAVLGLLTWRQAHVYYSLETLWRDTQAKNPDGWLAYNNLGLALSQAGKVEEAVEQWKQAVRLNPGHVEAHYNIGSALVHLGRLEEAIGYFKEALRIKPDYAEAHYNLGIALARAGRMPEAIYHFEEALRVEPNYAETHYNLGLALMWLGRVQEAIGHYEQALKIRPDYAEARASLQLARQTLANLQERGASSPR